MRIYPRNRTSTAAMSAMSSSASSSTTTSRRSLPRNCAVSAPSADLNTCSPQLSQACTKPWHEILPPLRWDLPASERVRERLCLRCTLSGVNRRKRKFQLCSQPVMYAVQILGDKPAEQLYFQNALSVREAAMATRRKAKSKARGKRKKAPVTKVSHAQKGSQKS